METNYYQPEEDLRIIISTEDSEQRATLQINKARECIDKLLESSEEDTFVKEQLEELRKIRSAKGDQETIETEHGSGENKSKHKEESIPHLNAAPAYNSSPVTTIQQGILISSNFPLVPISFL